MTVPSANGRPVAGSDLLEVRDLTIGFPAGDVPLLAVLLAAGWQGVPAVAAGPDGGFVVAWVTTQVQIGAGTTDPTDPNDRHDRIDFVLVCHGLAEDLQSAEVIGEKPPAADRIIKPWPSDHRAFGLIR